MATYNIYYSPTGGTKKVADILAGSLSESFENIDLLKKTEDIVSFHEDDLCVISVPAFGGRVPADAIRKLKFFKANKTNAVLVAVFGNRAIDDTLIELYDLAVSLGFETVAGIEAVAEHSLIRLYGAGRPNDQDRTELESFSMQILSKLNNGPSDPPSIPGNRPYKEFKASAMSLEVDDNCINCKKCARECPVAAIPMDNVKTVDAEKCFSCMRCVAVCPKSARHYSPSVLSALNERLRDRCSGVKPNKLYL